MSKLLSKKGKEITLKGKWSVLQKTLVIVIVMKHKNAKYERSSDFLQGTAHTCHFRSLNTSSKSWNTKKQNISKYPSSSSICLSHDCHDILPQESSQLPVQGVDLHLGGQQGLLLVVQLLAGGGKLLLGLVKLNLWLSLSNLIINSF